MAEANTDKAIGEANLHIPLQLAVAEEKTQEKGGVVLEAVDQRLY